MKSLLRSTALNTLAMVVAQAVLSGLQVTGGFSTFVLGGLLMTLMSLFLKPVLRILTLPLNLVTFGLFSFFTDAILLYLLTVFVPQVSINAFTFPGTAIAGFVIPRIAFNTLLAYIVVSISLSLIVTGSKWLLED